MKCSKLVLFASLTSLIATVISLGDWRRGGKGSSGGDAANRTHGMNIKLIACSNAWHASPCHASSSDCSSHKFYRELTYVQQYFGLPQSDMYLTGPDAQSVYDHMIAIHDPSTADECSTFGKFPTSRISPKTFVDLCAIE